MLNRTQKEQIVSELRDKLKESKTVVIADYKGTTVAQLQELRRSLRQKNAFMQVVKKTLATIALKESKVELDIRQLQGQAAIVYGGEDEITAPKTIAEFAKKNPTIQIMAGVLEGKAMSKEEIIALAKLPSKEQMLGQLVGTIQAPISGFVRVLSGNLQNLVGVLNNIKQAKEGK